ncbi:MAG: vitamin K epoxide reductase family protein [bacterium]|nr:vitamin K epoxide reductase family protein [bacterium]
MQNLNNTLLERSKSKKSRKFVFGLLGLSFLGFLDALYLTILHYASIPVSCGAFTECSRVLSSEYAVVLGIPLAALGIVYYLAVFLSAAFFLDTERRIFLLAASLLPFMGLVASGFFLYLQIAVIEALCPYCLVSAIITLLLACVAVYALWISRTEISL